MGPDTLCKLFPKEKTHMKCQIIFSRNNKKNISKSLLKFLPSMQTVEFGSVREGIIFNQKLLIFFHVAGSQEN